MNLDEVKKVALIDADSLVYYCALGNKENRPTLENAIVDLDSRINNMVDQSGADHYILFVSKTGKNFRKKVAKSYKANRKRTSMPPVYVGLKAYLEQKPAYLCYDFEADDAVGIFREMLESIGKDSVICSPDKDVLRQLPGIHFNYNKDEVVETTEGDAHYFLCKQLLMGDATDGVGGIPKIGDVKSDKILAEIADPEKYITHILELYIEKFGLINGIRNFSINFRLLYMLRSMEDVFEELGDDHQLNLEDRVTEILIGTEKKEGHLIKLNYSW
jgi:DNA polymerase-1